MNSENSGQDFFVEFDMETLLRALEDNDTPWQWYARAKAQIPLLDLTLFCSAVKDFLDVGFVVLTQTQRHVYYTKTYQK